jgi:hypothetical protein
MRKIRPTAITGSLALATALTAASQLGGSIGLAGTAQASTVARASTAAPAAASHSPGPAAIHFGRCRNGANVVRPDCSPY